MWEIIRSAGRFSANQAHPKAIPDAIVAKPPPISEGFCECCAVGYWSTSNDVTCDENSNSFPRCGLPFVVERPFPQHGLHSPRARIYIRGRAQVQCGWQEQHQALLSSDIQVKMLQSPPSRRKQEIFLAPSPPLNLFYWGSSECGQLSANLAHVF